MPQNDHLPSVPITDLALQNPAIAHDIIRQEKATKLLYSAQAALMSGRRKPRPERTAA